MAYTEDFKHILAKRNQINNANLFVFKNNPVLNIVGYKAFSIVYHKSTSAKRLDDDKSLQSFEIKVFSREPLNRMTREKLFVTFSPHDFSICYSIPREKSDL